MTDNRERCWITHKRREYWNQCPICGRPIKWVRLWTGEYSPCDIEPVLYSRPGKQTKYQVVAKHDIWKNVVFKAAPGEPPRYGWKPHFYSCPVLLEERREWARKNRI